MITEELQDIQLRCEIPAPNRWGIMINGCQEVMCKAIQKAIDAHQNRIFTYAEIGVAEAGTLGSIIDFLEKQLGSIWRVIGVDIPNGWSLNTQAVTGKLSKYSSFYGIQSKESDFSLLIKSHPIGITVYLKDSHEFFVTYKNEIEQIDFAFIDGCHGAPCVKKDFEVLESLISVGGMICFHDSNAAVQGLHMQPHCQKPIQVRQAIQELNLFENKRPNWKLLCDIDGAHGNSGCLIVTKISEVKA